MDRAERTLKRFWGYEDFRPGQEKMVNAILEGRDVLAVMPTGAASPSAINCPPLSCPE